MYTQLRDEIRNAKLSHFHIRLMERFALTISKPQLDKIISDIENYYPPPLRIEEDGKSFHRVLISGEEVIVLFDWEYMAPITCYHNCWLAQNEYGEWEQVKRYKSKNIRKYNKGNTLRSQGKFGFYRT